ncbi:MAG: EamA family transporter [Synergistaceae bacterium]|nr:EamA family transporter [Synergistaceae bacterium]
MILIFIAGVLWGTIGIFVNELNALGAGSSLTCFLRMFFAFVIMFSLAIVKRGKKFFIADRKTIFLCAMLGLVCHGIFNICYTASIKLNGMGVACVLMYSAPVFTAAASRIIFRERLSSLKIFALALNILGCVMTVTGGDIFNNSDISLIGILAGLGSGFCYGMAAIFGKALGEKTDSLTMSAYSYFFAVLFFAVFTRLEINLALENLKIPVVGFLYGLIPTSLAYLVYYNGLRRVANASSVPVIASIEPVAAVIIGMVIYNEHVGAGNFVGIAIVLSSIAIMMKKNK